MRTRMMLSVGLLVAVGAVVTDAATLKVPQQYPTINAAIAVAGFGDEILVSKGTYPENVSLVDKTGMKIRGKGKVKIVPTNGGAGIQIQDSKGIILTNLRVLHSLDDGISVLDSDIVIIRKCYVRNASGFGISVVNSHDVFLEKNKVQNSESSGISIDSYGVVVQGNTITDLKNGNATGVQITGHNIVIEENVIEDIYENGIVIEGGLASSQVLIADNKIKNAYRGILVRADVTGVTAVGNHITKTGEAGIGTILSSSLVILDNRVTRSGSRGLHLSIDDSIVSGNKLTKCHHGISVTGDNNDIHDNRMIKSVYTGFAMGFASVGNLVCGNEMLKSGQYDLWMFASYMDNDFVNNTYETKAP